MNLFWFPFLLTTKFKATAPSVQSSESKIEIIVMVVIIVTIAQFLVSHFFSHSHQHNHQIKPSQSSAQPARSIPHHTCTNHPTTHLHIYEHNHHHRYHSFMPTSLWHPQNISTFSRSKKMAFFGTWTVEIKLVELIDRIR